MEQWEALAAKGKPSPLDHRPELLPDLRWVWSAFWRLTASRQVGLTVGAIPFEAVDRYAERYGIEDFDEFDTLIRAMDAAYLEHVNRRDSNGGSDTPNRH